MHTSSFFHFGEYNPKLSGRLHLRHSFERDLTQSELRKCRSHRQPDRSRPDTTKARTVSPPAFPSTVRNGTAFIRARKIGTDPSCRRPYRCRRQRSAPVFRGGRKVFSLMDCGSKRKKRRFGKIVPIDLKSRKCLIPYNHPKDERKVFQTDEPGEMAGLSAPFGETYT